MNVSGFQNKICYLVCLYVDGHMHGQLSFLCNNGVAETACDLHILCCVVIQSVFHFVTGTGVCRDVG